MDREQVRATVGLCGRSWGPARSLRFELRLIPLNHLCSLHLVAIEDFYFHDRNSGGFSYFAQAELARVLQVIWMYVVLCLILTALSHFDD